MYRMTGGVLMVHQQILMFDGIFDLHDFDSNFAYTIISYILIIYYIIIYNLPF